MLGRKVEKGEGRSTNWQLQNRHGDTRDSTRNIVNNTYVRC